MLLSLHIENIAVIKSLDVDLGKGFIALTGETGAGKSIIIDSINMLTGGRFSRELIRTGEKKASVSGVFSIDERAAKERLLELGIEADEEGKIMLQKSVTDDGHSQIKVNGRTITAAVQRELCEVLINIYGQNETIQLMKKANHITMLDEFSKNDDALSDYRKTYEEYTSLKKATENLLSGDKEKNRLIEIYKFQISEIDDAKLKVNEDVQLEAECKRLQSLEKITKQTSFAYRVLYSSDKSASVTYLLDRAATSVLQIADVFPDGEEIAEKLKSYRYEIEDIAERISDFGEMGLDGGNPTERLNKCEGRLAAIDKLKRKYGSTIEEILEFRGEIAEKLDAIEQSDDKIAENKAKLKELHSELCRKASVLTERRKASATLINDRIADVLTFLDMPKVRFDVAINESDPNRNGFDDVEFLVSTNPGEPLKPLAKIASGGELSRIMLSMKSVFADKDSVGTLIFDEIDTGVSGKTSRKIGIKLKSIAKDLQVICVTHSAQIASIADMHFYISKGESDGRAVTGLTLLDDDGRINEIARILGGIDITDIQKTAAAEMIAEGRAL